MGENSPYCREQKLKQSPISIYQKFGGDFENSSELKKDEDSGGDFFNFRTFKVRVFLLTFVTTDKSKRPRASSEKITADIKLLLLTKLPSLWYNNSTI